MDRAGGALLGAAEGSLVIAVLLVLATTVLGRDHPVFQDTRTLAAFERVEAVATGAREHRRRRPAPEPLSSDRLESRA